MIRLHVNATAPGVASLTIHYDTQAENRFIKRLEVRINEATALCMDNDRTEKVEALATEIYQKIQRARWKVHGTSSGYSFWFAGSQ